MPMNNNQKGQSAAARLARLPMIHSAYTRLSVMYSDAKCSHPNLRSLCEGLESSVTAVLSPVIVRLEPHISIANDVACKSLDWLETKLPGLHTPTEQVVATTKRKMQEIQEVVSIAANGSVDCVHMAVTQLVGSVQRASNQAEQPLVARAISVFIMGLDSALSMSEALMDRVLPPTEEEKEDDAAAAACEQLGGFEVATPRRSYHVRLVSLAAKLYRRSYLMVGSRVQSAQVYCHADFVWIFRSGPGASDQMADLGLEYPGAASLCAASAAVSLLLYLPDI